MPSFLPALTMQSRPRLLCEVRSGGVVAARADDTTGFLTQVGYSALPANAVLPSVREANLLDRASVVRAVQASLERVKGNSRDMTLILPDAAVRVLLLDFDALPAKQSDAVPVMRFRLSKLLPFSAETCALSYQVLSQRHGEVKVMAVATPREVLDEYESVARDAGFDPGSVLPSTLAAIGSITATEPVLLLNMDENALTTAIVRRGDVLLYRTLDLHADKADKGGDGAHSLSVEVELHQAISVAAAYYEDMVGAPPRDVYFAGSSEPEIVERVAADLNLRVCDLVQASDLLAGATTTNLHRSLLAGVRGASAI